MLFQADVARSVAFGEMTVGRVLKALDRSGRPFTAEDAQAVFMVSELQSLKMTAAAGASLLGEFSAELRFVVKNASNRCWLAFVETPKGGSSVIACLSSRQLESVLDAHPFTQVLALHELAARAGERVAALEAAKEAA